MENEKLALIVEKALTCFKEQLPSLGPRQTFPKNYCEEVSSILLSILNDNGFSNFKMLRGTNNKGHHHFWLESSTHVIDLTAHQFNGISEPFILIKKIDYPLQRIFSKNIQERAINEQWEFLRSLMFKIKTAYNTSY